MSKLPKANAAKMASDLWHKAEEIEAARKKNEEDLLRESFDKQAPQRTRHFLDELGRHIRKAAEQGQQQYKTSIGTLYLDTELLRSELIDAGYRVAIQMERTVRSVAGADSQEFEECYELFLTVDWR